MESFMGWIGGKRLLRHAILERFPDDRIDRYIEVFGGAAWVLFAKEQQSGQLEVYNDADSQLVNLFRCIKYHCGELQRELECLPSSRELFFDFREQLDMQGLTDIQRAARFLYLVKLSFGSDHRSYSTASKSIDNVIPYLEEIKKRLYGVTIEHKDFENLIKVYDRKHALFYLDPPYVGTENYYDGSFLATDHQRLKSALVIIKGRFILSYNDDPLLWDLYADFRIERVSRLSSLSANDNKKRYAELIIRNF